MLKKMHRWKTVSFRLLFIGSGGLGLGGYSELAQSLLATERTSEVPPQESPVVKLPFDEAALALINTYDALSDDEIVTEGLEAKRNAVLRRLRWYRVGHPRSAEAYYWSARVYQLYRQDMVKARDLYIRSLKLDPRNADTWHRLGSLYQDRVEESRINLSTFQKALAQIRNLKEIRFTFDPEDEGFITKMAISALEAASILGDPLDTENTAIYRQSFGDFLILYRKDAREYYGENEEQIFERAVKAYMSARELSPLNIEIAYGFTTLFRLLKLPQRWKEGEAAYLYALHIAPDEAWRRLLQRQLISYARICGQSEAYQAYQKLWPPTTVAD